MPVVSPSPTPCLPRSWQRLSISPTRPPGTSPSNGQPKQVERYARTGSRIRAVGLDIRYRVSTQPSVPSEVRTLV